MQHQQRSHGSMAANALIYVLGFCLLIVTAFQTIDLLSWILPAKERFLVYAGLAAFDVGFIFWSIYYRHGWHNEQQKAIALIMIVLDFLSIAMCTISNIILNAVNRDLIKLDTGWIIAVIFAVSIVIVANVGTAMCIHLVADHHPILSSNTFGLQRLQVTSNGHDTDELESAPADPFVNRLLGRKQKKALQAAGVPTSNTPPTPTTGATP